MTELETYLISIGCKKYDDVFDANLTIYPESSIQVDVYIRGKFVNNSASIENIPQIIFELTHLQFKQSISYFIYD